MVLCLSATPKAADTGSASLVWPAAVFWGFLSQATMLAAHCQISWDSPAFRKGP